MKFVFSQMFDIRPRTFSGEVDIERISKIKSLLDLRGIPPVQPSLPRAVDVVVSQAERAEIRSKYTVALSRQGSLKPRDSTAVPFDPLDSRARSSSLTFEPRTLPIKLHRTEPKLDLGYVAVTRSHVETPPSLGAGLRVHGAPPPPGLPVVARESFDGVHRGRNQTVNLERLIPSFVKRSREALDSAGALRRMVWDMKDEALYIPLPKVKLRIPWSFAFAVFVAMLLVPAMAVIGSARSLAHSLETQAAEAAVELQEAARSMASLESAAYEQFSDAAERFSDARKQLSEAGFGILSFLAELPISKKLTSGKAILEAGEHLAQAGEDLSRSFTALVAFDAEQFFGDVFSVALNERDAEVAHAAGVAFEEGLLSAAEELSSAITSLEKVNVEAVPEEHRAKFHALLASIPTIREGIEAIHAHARAVAGIIGMREVRRYLVLLENASELRPTGGFIGNVALVTIANGRLIDLVISDTYLFDGQITRYTVPPLPLQDVSAAWSLHDSNWYRDFPTSAKIASAFFEVSGEATVDGVFALATPAVERLLEVIGPLETESGDILSADNFVDTLNRIGAAQRPGETTQVRAVSSIVPTLLERIASADEDERDALRKVLDASIAAGDIQVWFRNDQEQEVAERLGLTGVIPETDGDVLAVVHANVNGFKTDKVISEVVEHEAVVDRLGTVTVTVTLSRHHHGDKADDAFYRQVNKSYTRILVPRGSVLLAADGFTCKPEETPIHALDYEVLNYAVHPVVQATEASLTPFQETCVAVGEETGLTSFAGWLFVSPGETTVAQLRYRLPFKLEDETDSYKLLVVKQPGFTFAFTSTLSAHAPWRVVWTDEGYVRVDDTLTVPSAPLTKNRFLGAVLSRQ